MVQYLQSLNYTLCYFFYMYHHLPNYNTSYFSINNLTIILTKKKIFKYWIFKYWISKFQIWDMFSIIKKYTFINTSFIKGLFLTNVILPKVKYFFTLNLNLLNIIYYPNFSNLILYNIPNNLVYYYYLNYYYNFNSKKLKFWKVYF